MSKTIKVIDLLKEASEGNNITFRDGGGTYKDSLWTFINMYMDKKQSFDEIKELLNSEVVVIEEQEDINIQSIEEIPKILFLGTEKNDLMKVLNDIIDNQNLQLQAVKQLDKKMEEKNNGIK